MADNQNIELFTIMERQVIKLDYEHIAVLQIHIFYILPSMRPDTEASTRLAPRLAALLGAAVVVEAGFLVVVVVGLGVVGFLVVFLVVGPPPTMTVFLLVVVIFLVVVTGLLTASLELTASLMSSSSAGGGVGGGGGGPPPLTAAMPATCVDKLYTVVISTVYSLDYLHPELVWPALGLGVGAVEAVLAAGPARVGAASLVTLPAPAHRILTT